MYRESSESDSSDSDDYEEGITLKNSKWGIIKSAIEWGNLGC
jgi:hypothetical protein